MESENTLNQKELVGKLTETLHTLENFRTMLTKFVMDEKNSNSMHFDRANVILGKLKENLRNRREELKAADEVWLGYHLDDLEVELTLDKMEPVTNE